MAKTSPANGLRKGNLAWQIAWRFYHAKSSIRVLAFINRLTKLGIILGIGILLMTNSVLNGFQYQLYNRFLNVVPQALVFTTSTHTFNEGQALHEELHKFTNVGAVSPMVNKTVMLEVGNKKRVLNLFAIEPSTYSQVSQINEYLTLPSSFAVVLASNLDPQTALHQEDKVAYLQSLLASQRQPQNVTQDSEAIENEPEQEVSSPPISSPDITTYPSIVLGKQVARYLEVGVGELVRIFVFDEQGSFDRNQYFLVTAIVDSGGLFDKQLALINIYDSTMISGLTKSICEFDAQTGRLLEDETTTELSDSDKGVDSAALFNVDDREDLTSQSAPETANAVAGLPQRQIACADVFHTSASELANSFQLQLEDPDWDYIAPYDGWASNEELSYITWGRIYPNIVHDIPLVQTVLQIGLGFVVALASFNVICSILIQIKDKRKAISTLQALGLPQGQVHRIFVYYSLILSSVAVVFGCVLGIILSLLLEKLSYYLLNQGVEVLNAANYFVDFIPVQIQLSDLLLVSGAIIAVSVITAYLTSYFTNQEQIDVKYLK